MFIANFILGILVIGVGVLLLRFNFQVTNSFSKNNWFERKLGSGSSYMIFKLFSFLVIVFGFLLSFSLHDNVMSWLLSPLSNILGGN